MNTVFSVSQINAYIKGLFTRDPYLRSISVKGEISNCKYHSAGHIYFTIKDANGQLSCVMFAGSRNGLSFTLKEGQSVVVTGYISVYERDGKYQMYASQIEQEGIGNLFEEFEKLKLKLQAEGLFDQDHKKSIPPYISTLGIITAETGAALQDILNITRRRNPYIKCILYPARVQGKGAAATLIKGLEVMTRRQPDVIIIGRGGGSIEDLFEFNDEGLARAIYDCPIPVISAVGHEVDYTIADFVSDLRAPTPSAAAELAVYEYSKFYASLIDYHAALYETLQHKIDFKRVRLDTYKAQLSRLSPRTRLDNYRLRLATDSDKLSALMKARLTSDKHKLLLIAQNLKRLSPLDKLEQGYSYISSQEGHHIRSVQQVSSQDIINIRLLDGSLRAQILDTAMTEGE